MAKSTVCPTKEELREALEEYFAPEGFESFDRIYIKVIREDEDGNRVEKLLSDPQVVLEGERKRKETEDIDLFDFKEESSDDK